MSTVQQEFIQALTDQGDKYATSIEFERANIQTMEEQIQIMRTKTLQQRRVMGGVNASKDNHFMIQKQIHILENRLDKSLIKFNEAISHNKSLRDKIDDLRRERVVFENIYRKMERELQDRKKHMAEIIEISNQSYEQRDTFQMEVAAIEQANRKEQEEFDEQMQTLGRLLDTELQLPAPGAGLLTRAKSLSGIAAGASSKGGTGGFSPSKSGGGGTMRTTSRGGDGADLDKSMDGTGKPAEIDFHERAQNFEEAFNKIKAATGITEVDELVRTFIKNEEHNFSLFNYVNEQNNEIEKYEEQIQQLREEELKFAQESGNDVNQHKEILKDLESKLQASEAMAEKYEQRCQDLQRITESLKRGMQSIFSKFDFSDGGAASSSAAAGTSGGAPGAGTGTGSAAAGEDAQGSSAPPVVTEVNMVHHLGLIEQKANMLLQHYSQVRQLLQDPPTAHKMGTTGLKTPFSGGGGGAMDDGDGPDSDAAVGQTLVSVLGTGPKVPMGQDLLHVNPPKSDDYKSDESDEDDDGDTRPLTRDELKHRTLNKLQKRMGLSGTSGVGGGGAGLGGTGVSMGMGLGMSPATGAANGGAGAGAGLSNNGGGGNSTMGNSNTGSSNNANGNVDTTPKKSGKKK
jgi:coiled-coil domain-containing protein 63/114